MTLAVLSGCDDGSSEALPAQSPASPLHGQQPRQHPAQQQVEPKLKLRAVNHRQSPGVVAAGWADAPYNYGPTVMVEGDRKRMWWCSQYGAAKPAGDDILYGEARTLDGPFRDAAGTQGPKAVFSGSRRGFDAKHTCDPSVIKVDGVYYLYYTGARNDDHNFGNAIGVATSRDGITWRRANGGKPIVTPSHGRKRDNAYGVGQPSAVYLDGWFYLMFTDTTAEAAGWNGAGQFLLRSRDPRFNSGVEALAPTGFKPVPNTAAPRESSLVDAFSADLMWVDVLDAFAIAHQTKAGTTLTFWDRHFTVNPFPPVSIRGPWREGPGLVRTAHGHAPLSEDDPCGTVPLDVIRATQNSEAPTDMRHFGMDLEGARGCQDPQRALRILDGYTFPSPERTMDLVTNGKLIRVDRRSVAEVLARHVLEERPADLPELPVAARLRAGAPILQSPDNKAGMLLEDKRLWLVPDQRLVSKLAQLNGSKSRTVSDNAWSSHPHGGSLG
ncbi:beta-xylosidase [Thermocrispum agreste]|uniref:beta-xylosidase n=1 Tax=Thermocrispum agreste TaxID=37925 RepID=UPI00056F09FF|nr:beta-xylosidase [Thermocrispum agreste]